MGVARKETAMKRRVQVLATLLAVAAGHAGCAGDGDGDPDLDPGARARPAAELEADSVRLAVALARTGKLEPVMGVAERVGRHAGRAVTFAELDLSPWMDARARAAALRTDPVAALEQGDVAAVSRPRFGDDLPPFVVIKDLTGQACGCIANHRYVTYTLASGAGTTQVCYLVGSCLKRQ
jgi:hypothetical protein